MVVLKCSWILGSGNLREFDGIFCLWIVSTCCFGKVWVQVFRVITDNPT